MTSRSLGIGTEYLNENSALKMKDSQKFMEGQI